MRQASENGRSRLVGTVLAGAVLAMTVMAAAAGAVTPSTNNPAQRCVDQELVRPVVTQAELSGAGHISQSHAIGLEVAATPEECHGVVEREVQWEVTKNELRWIDGKQRHKFIRIEWFTSPGYSREAAGEVGISGAANPHRGEWVYYHCSVGRAKTKVRLNMRVIVTNLVTHKEAGRKIFWGPRMKIRGIGKGRGC
jgi:hypothetical protein